MEFFKMKKKLVTLPEIFDEDAALWHWGSDLTLRNSVSISDKRSYCRYFKHKRCSM